MLLSRGNSFLRKQERKQESKKARKQARKQERKKERKKGRRWGKKKRKMRMIEVMIVLHYRLDKLTKQPTVTRRV